MNFHGRPPVNYTSGQMIFAAYRRFDSSSRVNTARLTWKFFACTIALLLICVPRCAEAQSAPQHLLIYSIDVEGGQATLIVSPSGASMLVDTGWPGNNGRDADRIQAAMKDAGISRIDHLLITHFHVDHVGGVPNLVARVPVGEFLDHGPNREDSDSTREGYAAYQKAIGTSRIGLCIRATGSTSPG